MAWLTRKPKTITAAGPTVLTDPSTFPLGTPWSNGELERILFEDVYGLDGPPILNRTAAMRLPVVARARRMICSSISRMPLVLMNGDTPVAEQPEWLTASGGGQSPQLRIAWTVDDLLFYDWSCWQRVNTPDGIESVQRVPYGQWVVTGDNHIKINGTQVPDNQVILIGGFGNGILENGVDVLADTRDLYSTVRTRLKTPIPPLELHQTSGAPMTGDQVKEMLDQWRDARSKPGGGVAYTNQLIELKPLSGVDGDGAFMIDARNAAAIDLARLMGISGGMVDATAPKASLNYETQTGRNQEFTDLDVTAHFAPIEARLSMDDICAPGLRLAFDTTQQTSLTPSPTGPNFKD